MIFDVDRVRGLSWSGIRRTSLRWLERLALALMQLCALAFVVQYGAIVAQTVDHPYHLEWMEGGVVETVARVLEGKSIYGPPSLEFVPYLYTPLYFWVCGLVGTVVGVDFFACRLVSLLSVVALAGLLWRWTQRETGSGLWGATAVGLWCATYELSGRWFHLARVDSLGLALTIGGLFLLRFYPGWGSAVAGGLLLFLAYLTKQSALLLVAPVLLVMVATDFRRGMLAGGLLTVLFGLSILIGHWTTGGWWTFWIFEVARLHANLEDLKEAYWSKDLWRVAILVALALVGVLARMRRDPRAGAFALAMLGGATVMSYLSRMHSGGFVNVLMPVHYVIVLCAAIGCGHLSRESSGVEHLRLGGSTTTIGLSLALIFQLQSLRYSTTQSVPSPGAVAKGDAFISQVAAIEGEVLVPDHRWVQTRAGKGVHGLGMAARDVYRIEEPNHPARLKLLAELDAALAEQRFAAVIVNQPDSAPGLEKHYRPVREVPSPMPITGWRTRPWQVWIPRRDAAAHRSSQP